MKRKAGLARPVPDALKGRGKVQGFGRTSKAEKEKQRAIDEIIKKPPVVAELR